MHFGDYDSWCEATFERPDDDRYDDGECEGECALKIHTRACPSCRENSLRALLGALGIEVAQ